MLCAVFHHLISLSLSLSLAPLFLTFSLTGQNKMSPVSLSIVFGPNIFR